MKPLARYLCFLLLSSLACPAVAAVAGEYDFSAVTRQMTDNLDLYGGSVVVVVQQGEEVIYRFQAGQTQEDTKYGLASASKWLSGAIIMRMYEKGLFKLEDQVGKHLPFFNDHSNEFGVSGSVTVQQCCAMKSGLYSTSTNPEISRFLTLEESVNKIAADIPLAFVPGTKLAYEGCGLQTVGRICEVLDPQKRAWRTIAADELFTPVGMVSCDYNYFGDKNPAIAGGAQGTATAYLRFLTVLMNGGVTTEGQIYLRPRSMRHFLVNQTRGLPEHATPCPDPPEIYPNSTKPDYGTASWIMVDDPNQPASNEAVEVASPGAFGTWPWIDRQRNLRGIVYMYDNQFGGRKTFENNLKVTQAIRDAIDAVGEPAKPKAVIAASATSGRAPLTVDFDASGSTDPEGDALTCVWDFGTTAVLGKTASRTFTEAGSYDVLLNVTDRKGTYSMKSVTITVAPPNRAPEISSCSPETPHTMAAGTSQVFEVWPEDADGDTLTYAWKLDGAAAGANSPTFTYSPAVAAAGDHVLEVTASDGYGGSATMTWAVKVTSAAPVIALSTTALAAGCTAGASPAAGSFTVRNSGGGTLAYAVSDDVDWLSCAPASGESTGETDTITLSYATSALPAGTYVGTVTVTAGGAANSPQTVTVTLTVSPAGGGGGGGGGGGCSLAGASGPAGVLGWLLPWAALLAARLAARRRRGTELRVFTTEDTRLRP